MKTVGTLHMYRVGYQPLSGGVTLYRHGKDPRVALEQRDALQEVVVAACQHILHGMEDGASAEVVLDDKEYVIAILPTMVKKGRRLIRNPKLEGIR